MTPDEYKLLTLAADFDLDGEQLQKIKRYMSAINNPDHLIDLAVREGLAGFLYKSLLKSELLETIDQKQKQRLYTVYYLTIRHNLKLIHALNEILNPLVQKRVQVVLMQGISLLQMIYRDIGLRPMNDIDIWVLPNQYENVVDCLPTQGFKRNSIYPNTFSKGEVVLDVHTHILWGDRIQSRDMLINIDQVEIFRNAQQINADNTTALCLSPSDQFLYLSLHALKHNLERLIWLVDIKGLVANWELSDWKALIMRAENLGQQKQFFYILFVLTEIFKLEIPAEIASCLAGWKPNFIEHMALNRRINGSSIPTWSQLVLISAGKSLRERISFVKETLFPSPKILKQVFPNSSGLRDRQLYWKRLLQILGSIKT